MIIFVLTALIITLIIPLITFSQPTIQQLTPLNLIQEVSLKVEDTNP